MADLAPKKGIPDGGIVTHKDGNKLARFRDVCSVIEYVHDVAVWISHRCARQSGH